MGMKSHIACVYEGGITVIGAMGWAWLPEYPHIKDNLRYNHPIRRARLPTGRNSLRNFMAASGPSGDGPSGGIKEGKIRLRNSQPPYRTINDLSSLPSRMNRAKLPALRAASEPSPLVVTHRTEYRYPSGVKSLNTS